MVGWHHRLYGHGFGWTPGVGDGQGGLACCCSCGYKQSGKTEQLNIYIRNYTSVKTLKSHDPEIIIVNFDKLSPSEEMKIF